MTLGENIKRKRREYDIEQQELAQRIGVTSAHICRIEKGVTNASLEIISKIADALHCSIDELIGRKVS